MAKKKIYQLDANSSVASTQVLPLSGASSGDAKKETMDNIDDYLSQSTKTLTNKTIDAGSNTITGLVKGDVGLGNVDNTSDANKPISTATQTALDTKQATLVSGTNIKTVGGTSLLGSGDIILPGTGTVTSVSVVTANGISGSVATETTTPAITLDISGLDASKIADGSVSDAEFQYLDGVTSAIQTQINAKGDVSKVGTPVNNQVGVWTGDGTIEGAAGLTYDGTLLTSTATTEQLRLAYDSSNFFSTNVASTGQTTFEITGSAKYFRYTIGGASLPVIDGETIATFTKTTGAGSNAQISIISGTTGSSVLRFGDTASEGRGQIRYNNNTDGFELYTSEAVKAYLSSTGNFGVGVSPTHRLDSYISSSSTGVSTIYGLRDIPSGTISSGSSINGVLGQLTVSGSTTISTITATAGNFIAEHDGSSTVHELIGLRGLARTNAASTGVLASAKSILASAPANSQVGNTITNAYSLYIESPTAGTTLNYGLYQDGSAKNYFGGSVGIGSIPAAKLHSLSTTEQLRLGYDASNYASFTTSSGGDLTIAPSGGDTSITGTVSTTTFLAGDGAAATPSIRFTSEATGLRVTSGNMGFSVAGVNKFFVSASSLRAASNGGFNLAITTTPSATAPLYSIRGDENTGMYSDTADTLQFTTGGTERVRITSTGNVGVGATPGASAKLQVDSTTQGFLPPRMTTAQRDAISSPAAGLMIYNTTTNKLNVYTTAWEQITSA